MERYPGARLLHSEAPRVPRETFTGSLQVRLFSHPGAEKKVRAIDSGEGPQFARVDCGKGIPRDPLHIVMMPELLQVDTNLSIGDGAQREVSAMR